LPNHQLKEHEETYAETNPDLNQALPGSGSNSETEKITFIARRPLE
jgi:hypothetical protein